MATDCSILAWRIPWTEQLGRLQTRKELDTTEQLNTALSLLLLFDSASLGMKTTIQIPICLVGKFVV